MERLRTADVDVVVPRSWLLFKDRLATLAAMEANQDLAPLKAALVALAVAAA